MKELLTRSIIILVFMGIMSCSGNKAETPSVKADETVSSEWISLFDGESLDGWKRFNADEIGPIWKVDDKAIMCDGVGRGEGSGEYGGSLITLRKFTNFELELEWRISEGGNSGILYHVIEKPEYSHAYVSGPEYQVHFDNSLTGDESTDNKKVGSCYDMYAASADKKTMPVMEWNTSRIIYNNGKVEYWLNGVNVVSYDEASEDYKNRLTKSKWNSGQYPDWHKIKEGSIALQDHGAQVWYRNIRIKDLGSR